MPDNFENTYPNILDCNQLFWQNPSFLKAQSSLYSFYKHHAKYKGLAGGDLSLWSYNFHQSTL